MKKVGHYRRAIWLAAQHRTLSRVVRDCLEAVPQNQLHVFDYSATEQALLARSNVQDGRLFLHLVVYERGAGAAVIPIVRQAREAQADEVPPPPDREYIVAQVFLLIRRDHVVWTTHNSVFRDSSIYDLVAKLISSLMPNNPEVQFQFRAIIDRDVYRQVFENGIEEIDLGLGDFQSTLEQLIGDGALPDAPFIEQLKSLVRRRPTAAEVRAASMVEAILTLKPGRDWNKPNVTPLLQKVAEGAIEGDEEFTILAKGGLRLTRDRMTVQQEFRADGNRRILSSIAVETAHRRIMQDLERLGVIEE